MHNTRGVKLSFILGHISIMAALRAACKCKASYLKVSTCYHIKLLPLHSIIFVFNNNLSLQLFIDLQHTLLHKCTF